jgi:hypothetical protein
VALDVHLFQSMTTANLPDFTHGTAAQALAFAREHGIKGRLIRRTKTREIREYVFADGVPNLILATADEHVS